MLPASTTWRNRLRSTKSKCMAQAFASREGNIQEKRIACGPLIAQRFAIGEGSAVIRRLGRNLPEDVTSTWIVDARREDATAKVAPATSPPDARCAWRKVG